MKKAYKNIILGLILVFSWNLVLPSVLAKTVIKTSSGLVPIENLHVGDYVTSLNLETNSLADVKITKISKKTIDAVILIETDNGIICASKGQLFYDPNLSIWIEAQNLTTNNKLIDSDFRTVECFNITVLNFPVEIYEISVEDPHLFFCSDYQIVTHNFAGLIEAGGQIIFNFVLNEAVNKAATTIGVGLFGWLANKLFANSSNNDKALQYAKRQALEYAKENGNKVLSGAKSSLQETTKQIYKKLVKSIDTVQVGNRTLIGPKGMKLSKLFRRFNIPYDKTKSYIVSSYPSQNVSKSVGKFVASVKKTITSVKPSVVLPSPAVSHVIKGTNSGLTKLAKAIKENAVPIIKAKNSGQEKKNFFKKFLSFLFKSYPYLPEFSIPKLSGIKEKLYLEKSKKAKRRKAEELKRQSELSAGNPRSPDDPGNNGDKKRKINRVTKQEAYKCLGKKGYERYRNDVLRRKPGHEGLGKDAEYLEWDYLHNEIEAYGHNKKHTGAIDPSTWEFYKPADPIRSIFDK